MSNFICNEVIPVALSDPAGWLLFSTRMPICCKNTALTRSRLADDPQEEPKEQENAPEPAGFGVYLLPA